MTGRGAAALAALLVVGILGGYAVAGEVLGAPSAAPDGVRPLPPTSPSLPLDPPAAANPDPTNPPMARGLTLVPVTVGTRFPISVPVPENWVRQDVGEGEATWKPRGYRNFTYILRVQRVASGGRSIPSSVENAIEDLGLRHESFDVLEQTPDAIEVAYLFRGYRRYSYLRWFDPSGSGRAEVLLTLTGRERDVPGMDQLYPAVAEGIGPA